MVVRQIFAEKGNVGFNRRHRQVRGPGQGRRHRPGEGDQDRAHQRLLDRQPDADQRGDDHRDQG